MMGSTGSTATISVFPCFIIGDITDENADESEQHTVGKASIIIGFFEFKSTKNTRRQQQDEETLPVLSILLYANNFFQILGDEIEMAEPKLSKAPQTKHERLERVI